MMTRLHYNTPMIRFILSILFLVHVKNFSAHADLVGMFEGESGSGEVTTQGPMSSTFNTSSAVTEVTTLGAMSSTFNISAGVTEVTTLGPMSSTLKASSAVTEVTTLEPCSVTDCEGCDECDPTSKCKCTCINGYMPNNEGQCDAIVCSKETIPYENCNSTNVTFPETQAGFLANSVEKCQNNTNSAGTLYGTRLCNLNGSWADPKWISSCNISLQGYVNKPFASEEDRQTAANDLQILTSEPDDLNANDVTATVQALEAVVNTDNLNQETSSAVIATVGNLLGAPEEDLQQSGQADSLFRTLDSVSESVDLKEGEAYEEITSTVAVSVIQPTLDEAKKGISYQFTALPTTNNLGFREDQLKTFVGSSTNTSSFIQLPYDAINQSPENRVSFYAFLDDKIFRTSPSSNRSNQKEELSSEVIFSATVVSATQKISNLAEPVVMKFSFKSNISDTDNKTAKCVFWNEPESEWSSEGVINQTFNNESIECSFSHLTNFATLLSLTNKDTSNINLYSLDIITIVGCSVSSVSLVLLIITFIFFRNTRKESKFRSAFLLINLATALLMLNVLLIISEQEFAIDSEIGCQVIAILIHFSLLASLLWMLVEAVNIYLAVVHGFYTKMYLSDTSVVVSSIAAGWMIPAVFVAVLAGINADAYYKRNDQECWITTDMVLYFVVIPIAIILIINIILYVVILAKIVCRKRPSNIQARKSRSYLWKNVGISLILFITLGGTWAFGFGIAAFEGISTEVALVFAYVFSVCNALQGFFLFVLYGVRQSATWKALKSKSSKIWSTAFAARRKSKTPITSQQQTQQPSEQPRVSNSMYESIESIDMSKEFKISRPRMVQYGINEPSQKHSSSIVYKDPAEEQETGVYTYIQETRIQHEASETRRPTVDSNKSFSNPLYYHSNYD